MTAKQYIREIVQRSCLPAGERRRIKADLESEINSALERGEDMEWIIRRMGEPDEVAAGLYESYHSVPERPFREYKSKRTLFGLPLVHIIRMRYAAFPRVRASGVRLVNIGGRYGYGQGLSGIPTARGIFAFGPKAKGVVAVGNLSTGIVSLGNVSAGLISIGNVSAGVLSLGNLSAALLVALGNLTAGLLSAGNLALGRAAAGNLAFGEYAAGNLAFGEYAVGNVARGGHTFELSDLPAQLEQVRRFFAGFEAPAYVKSFFGAVEAGLEMLLDPAKVIWLSVSAAAAILALVLMLGIVPGRMLKNKELAQK